MHPSYYQQIVPYQPPPAQIVPYHSSHTVYSQPSYDPSMQPAYQPQVPIVYQPPSYPASYQQHQPTSYPASYQQPQPPAQTTPPQNLQPMSQHGKDQYNTYFFRTRNLPPATSEKVCGVKARKWEVVGILILIIAICAIAIPNYVVNVIGGILFLFAFLLMILPCCSGHSPCKHYDHGCCYEEQFIPPAVPS